VAGLGSEKTADRIGRPINVLCGKSGKVVHFVTNTGDFKLPARSLERDRRATQEQFYDEKNDDVVVQDGTDIVVETWPEERTDIEWQGLPHSIGDGNVVVGYGDWQVFSETAPNIAVRVGSIYALERISQDSVRDHIRIMEILTAYVRENAPKQNLKPSEDGTILARPRADIQAAIDVIGRRQNHLIELEYEHRYRLDLRDTNLTAVNFARGNFSGAILTYCRLGGARFREAKLAGIALEGSLLNFSDFRNADLSGAILDLSTCSKYGRNGAPFTYAADIRGVSLAGADITAISFLPSSDTHIPTFGTKDTRLSPDLEAERQSVAKEIDNLMYAWSGHPVKKVDEITVVLRENGFLGWSPFDYDDGATKSLWKKVQVEAGTLGFPYWCD